MNKPPVTMTEQFRVELGLSRETMRAHGFRLKDNADIWVQDEQQGTQPATAH